MRIPSQVIVAVTLLACSVVGADFENANVPKVKHDYQSDVTRMRNIVINSLYSHRDIFIRELISNANDALEKLRLLALTDKTVWDGSAPLNVTIKAIRDEDGSGGRLIITDTGVGMSAEDLTKNLGTLARSGTAEFLAKAENSDSTGTGNLIGAFGLGFYSSFLVADQVYVASIPFKSEKNPNPTQHVFSSNAEDSAFEIFPDPRGNTLGRGTEITLVLKKDALEFLEGEAIAKLINKHSAFASGFPIYLHKMVTKEVPDEDDTGASNRPGAEQSSESSAPTTSKDSDEALVEDVPEPTEGEEKAPPQKMKKVLVEEWGHLNAQPPLWQRDPKEVNRHEYSLFYQATFKEFSTPLAWHHFSGDADGVTFKGILYIPSKLDESFWSNSQVTKPDVRLMVKRVFITSDLGEDALPKWAHWVKAVVDADDLPLNVSRETLQSTRFLRQLRQVITKHAIQLLARLAAEDTAKFEQVQEQYSNAIKLGAIEDQKNREKLTALVRFSTNQRNNTSLDQYLENKKQGQKQIFYLADVGTPTSDLAKSVFIEKLHARGYEVLLVNEGFDEIMFQNLGSWKKIPFQDVAKAGLQFGDEDLTPTEQKEKDQKLKEEFQPLLDWLKRETAGIVRDVVISTRLVISPCAVVADVLGYTANVEKLISASQNNKQQSAMHELAKRQKVLEINPRSPLIEGLLRRVRKLDEAEVKDPEVVDELKEVTTILIDTALVRSGFQVPDTHEFFVRVDKVLRRSLGVSETALTDTKVEPAPPVDPKLPEEEEGHKPEQTGNKDGIKEKVEELVEDEKVVHIEL